MTQANNIGLTAAIAALKTAASAMRSAVDNVLADHEKQNFDDAMRQINTEESNFEASIGALIDSKVTAALAPILARIASDEADAAALQSSVTDALNGTATALTTSTDVEVNPAPGQVTATDPATQQPAAPAATVTPVVVAASAVAAAGNGVAEDGTTVVDQSGKATGQAVLDNGGETTLPVIALDPATAINAPVIATAQSIIDNGHTVDSATGTVVDVAGMPTGAVINPQDPAIPAAALAVDAVHTDAPEDATNDAAPLPTN